MYAFEKKVEVGLNLRTRDITPHTSLINIGYCIMLVGNRLTACIEYCTFHWHQSLWFGKSLFIWFIEIKIIESFLLEFGILECTVQMDASLSCLEFWNLPSYLFLFTKVYHTSSNIFDHFSIKLSGICTTWRRQSYISQDVVCLHVSWNGLS